ncbi:alpha/beta hydrolase [Nodosilinea sp. AN01ver1]|uniref:alpha/beta hydrolase n=1 Tax=Nodosilinea sp. AN01ver1 TaxID=3423362 RepID=UPI003D322ABB
MTQRLKTHRLNHLAWLLGSRFLRASFLGAGLLQPLVLTEAGLSAEQVYVSYGPIERAIDVEDLHTYARTGQLTDDLNGYRRFLTSEQLEQFRTGLTVSADLDVVTVAQFLYTSQGEAILQLLGDVIQTSGRLNGAQAIRAALILAAADSGGQFNLLNVLDQFPTEGVRVDLQQLSRVADIVFSEINQTQQVTAQIREQAAAAVEPDRALLPAPANPADPGPYRWERRSLDLHLPTNLYLPEGQKAPLVVISHGLGGNRSTFAYLAEHLASHGLAVAVVEHPGSSAAQIEALLGGRADEAIRPEEMISRPIDIQRVLDDLALAARDSALGRRLDLERIGVLGQSLGAYTTLALAGATVSPSVLEQRCPPQLSSQINLSLLVQCPVLTLPQPLPPLGDRRVQAAIAINPLDSAIFGPEGVANIDVPLMIVSGSADTVTPALAEQIRPFTWLESPESYLLLMENGTHFSTIYDPQTTAEALPVPQAAIGPNPEAAQTYIEAMGVAFFKVYLAKDDAYRQYLNPSYAAALSRPDLPAYLVRDVTLSD